MAKDNTVYVVTDPSIGGTFLSWTLHFLAGHDRYFKALDQSWEELTHNPLTKINSHGFMPNRIQDLERFDSVTSLLNRQETPSFHTVYFHNFRDDSTTPQAINQLATATNKILVLSDPLFPLYKCKLEGRNLTIKVDDPSQRYSSFQEQHEAMIDLFFKESVQKWKELDLNEIWDQREFLALNIRPFDTIQILPHIHDNIQHHYIEAVDFWTNGDNVIIDAMDYLGIEINKKRLEQWIPIFCQWKTMHHDRLRFAWNFNSIVQAIIDGRDMDLDRFNLDIVREAAIQHVLIYQYGLNFKTFNLLKMNNTKDLHNLLEKNIHEIQPYDIARARYVK